MAGILSARGGAATTPSLRSSRRCGRCDMGHDGSMRIRDADASDCAELTRLVRTSPAYQGEYRVMVADVTITAEQVVRDDMLVAEADGRIIGFCSLTASGGEPELDYMFVDDAIQRSGVGQALWSAVVARARARGFAAMKIVSHPPAEAFYRRMGARTVGLVEPSGRVTWARPLMTISLDHRD
jgi:N-acetylglutamate synthase-like GNAT family acetyltransferase